MKNCASCGKMISHECLYCPFCGEPATGVNQMNTSWVLCDETYEADYKSNNNSMPSRDAQQPGRDDGGDSSMNGERGNTRYLRLVAFALILIVFLLIIKNIGGFGGATTSRGKGKNDILKDIETKDAYFSSYNLRVESANITKRQTNPEFKTDYVYIDIKASNKEFEYMASYYLSYELYNSGWILERYDKKHSEIKVKNYSMVSNEEVESIIDSLGYDQWTLRDRIENGNSIEFQFDASKYEYRLYSQYVITVGYNYSPSDSWGSPHIKTDLIYSELDVVGKWALHDENHNFELEIISIDYDTKTIEMKYRFGTKNVIASDGVVKLEFGYYTHKDIYMDIPNTLGGYPSTYSIWIHVGQTHNLTDGGEGYGVSFEGWWLFPVEEGAEKEDMSEGEIAYKAIEYARRKNIPYLDYENRIAGVWRTAWNGGCTFFCYDSAGEFQSFDTKWVDGIAASGSYHVDGDSNMCLLVKEPIPSEQEHKFTIEWIDLDSFVLYSGQEKGVKYYRVRY